MRLRLAVASVALAVSVIFALWWCTEDQTHRFRATCEVHGVDMPTDLVPATRLRGFTWIIDHHPGLPNVNDSAITSTLFGELFAEWVRVRYCPVCRRLAATD